jgi:hypothetical protein
VPKFSVCQQQTNNNKKKQQQKLQIEIEKKKHRKTI